MIHRIAQSPIPVYPNKCFRDKRLNPKDIYIPPPRRAQIRDLLDGWHKFFSETHKILGPMKTREVTAAIASGKAVSITNTPRVPKIEKRIELDIELLQEFWRRQKGVSKWRLARIESEEWKDFIRWQMRTGLKYNKSRGKVDVIRMNPGNRLSYGISVEDLPLWRQLNEIQKIYRLDFAIALTSCFRRAGTLSTGAVEEFLTNVYTHLYGEK